MAIHAPIMGAQTRAPSEDHVESAGYWRLWRLPIGARIGGVRVCSDTLDGADTDHGSLAKIQIGRLVFDVSFSFAPRPERKRSK